MGLVRTNNEDAFIVTDLAAKKVLFSSEDTPNAQLLVHLPDSEDAREGLVITLADGMGGAHAGEIAAQITVDAIHQALIQLDNPQRLTEDADALLNEMIESANQEIIDYAREHPVSRGMGTTCILAHIAPDGQCHIAWVGDSRAYLFHPDRGLRLVSKDHSLVQELVDMNQITQEDAFYHPDSNIITQSLGDPDRDPSPGHLNLNILPGDTLLLCTDGLNSMLQDSELEALLFQNTEKDPRELAEILIQAANDAGGGDNTTIALYQITGEEATNSFTGVPSEHLAADSEWIAATDPAATLPRQTAKGWRKSTLIKLGLAAAGIVALAYLLLLPPNRPATETPVNGEPTRTDSAQMARDSVAAQQTADSLRVEKAIQDSITKVIQDSIAIANQVTLQVLSNQKNRQNAVALTDQLFEEGYAAECQCEEKPYKVLVKFPTRDSAEHFKTLFKQNHPDIVRKFNLNYKQFTVVPQ